MTIWLPLLALNYLSWALLCLGLARHYRQHFGSEPSLTRRRVLRMVGWLATLLAYAIGVRSRGWDIGSVDWCASWMLTAIVWVLLQPYLPRVSRWLAFIGALSALALTVYPSPAFH